MLKRLLLLVMLICSIVSTVIAQCVGITVDGIAYTIVTDKNYAAVTGNNSNGYETEGPLVDVVIPETVEYNGELYPVTEVSSYAFYKCTSIKTLSLPGTITQIGEYAFRECPNLQRVSDMPNVNTIGKAAFRECASLQSVGDMPKLKAIRLEAFWGCAHLETVGDMTSVEVLENDAFRLCANLRSVGDLPELTTIGQSVFYYCEGLESVGEMPKVKTINIHAFEGCKKIKSVGDFPALTTIGNRAFALCDNLQRIGDMPMLTSLGNESFSKCYNLKEIGKMPALTSIGQCAFSGCKILKDVGDLPLLKTIGNDAFYECAKLETVGDLPSLTSIGNSAFHLCINLKSVGDMPKLTTIGNYAFYYCTALETIGDMPELTSIYDAAFRECSKLKSIGDLLHIVSISDNAFTNCSVLQSVGDMPELVSIGNSAFNGCKKLNSIGNLNSLTRIGDYAFYNTSLTELNLSTSVVNVGKQAFAQPVIAYFAGMTPPEFTDSSLDVSIVVPSEAYEAYVDALPDMPLYRIITDGEPTAYEVTVSALDNDSDLLRKVNQGSNRDRAHQVIDLKVKGTINSYDVMVIRNKMLNLRALDLSDATIVANSYEYFTGEHTEDNVIGTNMFKNLNLLKIVLPNDIKSIKSYAFSGCNYVREISIPEGVTSIGNYAFSSCYNLQGLNLPESLKTINFNAFAWCESIREIVIPSKVEILPDNCFSYCYSLSKVSLPPTLQRIGSSAFSECKSLAEIRIPAGVNYIGNYAIPSSVKDVYTYTIQPTNIGQSTFGGNTYLTATLHVPETSDYLYYWDTQWSQFQSIVNFNEPYSYFYLDDKDLIENPDTPRIDGETDDETGEKKNPDADLGMGSGLVVEGDESQNLGNVGLEHDGNGNGATIIGGDSNTSETGGNINIDMLNIRINVDANKWYFFSFPFDIKCSDIKFNGQMVWRYYDSEWRALYGSGAWKNLKDEYLSRGIGYIFQASKAGTLTLSIPNASFDAQDWKMELEQNVSAMKQDANWNFIGNPFQSYYELADLGFDGPITWWNPNTKSYEAYSPLDDDMTLYPFMAFFVQKPEGVDSVSFESAFQETGNQKNDVSNRSAARRRRAARSAHTSVVDRELINIAVTDGTTGDRTRIVFNEIASSGYKAGEDASKFMSSEAPQIYSIDEANVQYAINERPVGEGSVRLGFYAPTTGVYTIECTRNDCPVTLRDLKMNLNVELTAGEKYQFTANQGFDNDRFEIARISDTATGVNEVYTSEDDATYYDINALKINGRHQGVMIGVRGNDVKKIIK